MTFIDNCFSTDTAYAFVNTMFIHLKIEYCTNDYTTEI